MNAASFYLTLAAVLTCSTSAQHPSLQNAVSKIDQNGSYLSINRVDSDLTTLSSYADEYLKLARAQGKPIPASLDIQQVLKISGLDHISAIARSNTAVDTSWLNQAYIQTDGSREGIFSLFSAEAQPFIVPQIAPLGTDIAIQLELDLRKSPPIARALAKLFDTSTAVDQSLSKVLGPFEVTLEEALKNSNIRAIIAIQFDNKNRFELGKLNIGRPQILIRIDGLHWLWKKSAERLMNNLFIPFDHAEKDGIITYSSPPEMIEAFQGFEPTMVVDTRNDQIWIATSPALINQARADGNHLIDDPQFLATWQGLPKSGNSMAYISKSFLTELDTLYKKDLEKSLFDLESFKNIKPFVAKILTDTIKTNSGLALSLQHDPTGIHFASKLPFPDKFLNLIPILKAVE